MSCVKQYKPTADFTVYHVCHSHRRALGCGLSVYRQFRKMAGILEHGEMLKYAV